MENKETTTLFLIPTEVQKFLLFQEYYELFNILLTHKVFEQKNATVLIDFDHEGILKSIRRNDYMYSRKFS